MTSSATTLIPAVDELDSHQEWRVADPWVEILRRFCHDRSKSVLPKKPGFIFNRVIVVEARTNHVAYLRPFVPNLLAIVESARRSTASIVRPLKNKTFPEFVDEYSGASTARVYDDWRPILDRSIGERRVAHLRGRPCSPF